MDAYNERDIISRIVAGDEAAFAMFFRRHHPKIYQVGLLLTHSAQQAEELVQEVFMKVWLKRAQLSAITDVSSWLFIIARNDAFKALQRHSRQQGLLQSLAVAQDMEDISHETDDLIIYRNYHELLGKAIGRLSPRQQLVWRLSKEEGLKREEIAARLDIRPDTVKEYLAAATKHIRAYLLSQRGIKGGAEVLFIWSLYMMQ